MALRGFLVDGKPDAASQMFRDGVRIYPLDRRDDPPAMEFINASGQSFNTIHANNVEFYDELHAVIDREPVDMIDPETRGLLASIGIRKGQPFEPDERLRAILIDAAAVANATARATFFKTDRSRQLPVRGQLLEARLLRRRLPVPPGRRAAASATSTPAPPSSTWPPSTPRRWRRR